MSSEIVLDSDEKVSFNSTNKRNLHPMAGKLVFFWAVFGTLMHLYSIFIAFLAPQVHLAMHIMFALSLVFIMYKAKDGPITKEKESIAWYDFILTGLSVIVNGYIILNWQAMIGRVARPTNIDILFALILIVLILEGTRRVMGLVLPIIALLFTAYAFFGYLLPDIISYRGARLARFASIQYMTTEGIWSTPTQVSAKMIFMFTMFGAFLMVSGAGDRLMAIAMAFAGNYTGGPGKVAVVSSGLMGMVSGSASANVATTGQFTIPMMKKIGFTPRMAGAIEAVASTGGTLAPPVMGAGAFIMAEMLGVSYLDVAKAAAIPALIYYISAFAVVHFESKRLGLSGVPKSELPEKWKSVKEGYLVLIPLILLLYLVFSFYPIMKAALYATAALVVLSWFEKSTRMGPQKLLAGMADTMRGMITLALCCASAGIVVGCIALTGLGPKFAAALVTVVNSSEWVALAIAAVVTIILGMGLPATAAYVVGASVAAPALLRMGMDPLGTQMFIFYFSCLAQITPPVALASYVGAALAQTDPLKTALTSVRLGLVSLIIPFIFVKYPTLLLQGSAGEVVWDSFVATVGCVICAIGLIGYYKTEMAFYWRGLCVIAGLMLIHPSLVTDAVGVALTILVLGFNSILAKKQGVKGPPPPKSLAA